MTKVEYLALFNNLFDSLQANSELPATDKMDIMEEVKNTAGDLMTEFDGYAGAPARGEDVAGSDDFGTSAVVLTAPLTDTQMQAIQVEQALIGQHLTQAMQDSIRQRVIKVISEQLGVSTAEVNDDQHVVNDLGADSLDTVELLMALEDEFMLEIPEEKEQVYLVRDITRGIQAAVARGEGK